jgi:hypothetical protein
MADVVQSRTEKMNAITKLVVDRTRLAYEWNVDGLDQNGDVT